MLALCMPHKHRKAGPTLPIMLSTLIRTYLSSCVNAKHSYIRLPCAADSYCFTSLHLKLHILSFPMNVAERQQSSSMQWHQCHLLC